MPKAKVKTKGVSSPSDYFYQGTNIFKNKHGIRDSDIFMERYSSGVREKMALLRKEENPEYFDSSYLCYIHKKLFLNFFEWAGCLRSVPFTCSDGTVVAMPEMANEKWDGVFASGSEIQENLQQVDQTLSENDNLQGLSHQEFVQKIAALFAFLHYTAPFRAGNEETLQIFCEKLGDLAGHQLDFSLTTPESMAIANMIAEEEGDMQPLEDLFAHISNPEHISKQRISQAKMQQKERVKSGKRKTLKDDDETSPTAQKTEKFDKVLIPGKIIPPLTRTDIVALVEKDACVCTSREQIQILSKDIYGNPKVLDPKMKYVIINPSFAQELSNQVERAPESIANLAGVSVFGLKNARRRKAEECAYMLPCAIMNFSRAVKYAESEIIQDYQKEQKRCANEVRMPSENLQDFLALPKEEQKNFLEQSSTLFQELGDFVKSVNGRLSLSEQKAIKRSDHKKLAKMVGVSEEKAKQIIDIVQTSKEIYQRLQMCTESRVKTLAIAS